MHSVAAKQSNIVSYIHFQCFLKCFLTPDFDEKYIGCTPVMVLKFTQQKINRPKSSTLRINAFSGTMTI